MYNLYNLDVPFKIYFPHEPFSVDKNSSKNEPSLQSGPDCDILSYDWLGLTNDLLVVIRITLLIGYSTEDPIILVLIWTNKNLIPSLIIKVKQWV